LIFILRLLSVAADDEDDDDPLTDSVSVAVAEPPPPAGTFKVAPDGIDAPEVAVAAVVVDVVELFVVDIVLSMSASKSMIKFPRSTSGQLSLSVSKSKLLAPPRNGNPEPLNLGFLAFVCAVLAVEDVVAVVEVVAVVVVIGLDFKLLLCGCCLAAGLKEASCIGRSL
jgi:hypothetical protein